MLKTLINKLKFRSKERNTELDNDQLEKALKAYYNGEIDAAKIVSIASGSLGHTFELSYLEEDRPNFDTAEIQPG